MIFQASSFTADLTPDDDSVSAMKAALRDFKVIMHEPKAYPKRAEMLDPNRHQAMIEIPSADAKPGTIVQEMQAGYMIKDRLLRPAMVGVAKAG